MKKKEEVDERKVVEEKAPASAEKRPHGASMDMEVKLGAVDELASGLNAAEVAELVGINDPTIHQRRRQFQNEGNEGFRCSPSEAGVRCRCNAIEKCIVE